MKNYSHNPLINEKYEIPSALDDRVSIEKFISHNVGKSIVVVQGLGFVGAVTCMPPHRFLSKASIHSPCSTDSSAGGGGIAEATFFLTTGLVVNRSSIVPLVIAASG